MNILKLFADKSLVLENSILKQRLEKLESNYGDPYMKGFSHGIDMTFKFMPGITEKFIENIKSEAIQSTLTRINGNNKKKY